MATNLSYPNISFRETIVGPRPQTRPWESFLGVVGTFRRGPATPQRITSRQEFVYLYGEDTSAGSLAVQQALTQGATDFIIARAVPQDTAGVGTITLQNSNPDIPAQVALEGTVQDLVNYTTGLTLQVDYIGDAIEQTTLCCPVHTQEDQVVSHPDFLGRARIRFIVANYELGAAGNPQIGTNTAVMEFIGGGPSADPQIAIMDKTQAGIDDFVQDLLPGRVLLPDVAAGGILSDAQGIKIESTFYDYSPTHWGVVVSNLNSPNGIAGAYISPTGAPFVIGSTTFDIEVPSPGPTPAIGDVFIHAGTVYTIVSPTPPLVGPGLPGFDIYSISILGPGLVATGTANDPIDFILPAGPAVETMSVHQPIDSVYALGYAYEAVDSVDLSEPSGTAQYQARKFEQPPANLQTANVDGYWLVEETDADTYLPWQYWVVEDPGTSDRVLGYRTIGINVYFDGLAAGLLAARINSSFIVPIGKAIVTAGGTGAADPESFPVGHPATEVLRELDSAIAVDAAASGLISETDFQFTLPPYSLSFTSSPLGADSGRMFWTLTRQVEGTDALATDLLFNGSTLLEYGVAKKFLGNGQGPQTAFQDFYAVNGEPFMRVIALSPGAHGNDVRITITPLDNGDFRLDLVDLDTGRFLPAPVEESFVMNARNANQFNGAFPEVNGSQFIRALYLPFYNSVQVGEEVPPNLEFALPLRLQPAFEARNAAFATGEGAFAAQGGATILSVPLVGGSDIPDPNDVNFDSLVANAYLEAVKRLEEEHVNILILPGATYGEQLYQPAFDEAKAQVERSTTQNTLRIAVFDAPANLTPKQATSFTAEIDSPRVVLLGGHFTYRGQQQAGFNAVAPSGTYAGFLTIRPPHISPPATYGGQTPRGVVSVDTPTTPRYLDAVTIGKTEVLHFDTGLRRFKFLSGITTSSEPVHKYVSVRRIMDQIMQDLYGHLQWVRSEPNTRELQSRVATGVDAYLIQRLRDDYLVRIAPTICGPENNTITDMVNGILNIRIRVTPVFPADFFRVHVIRDLTEDFSLDTATVGQSVF